VKIHFKVLVFAVALVAEAFQPAWAEPCFAQDGESPSSVERWIPLKTTLDEPHFYYLVDEFSIFVPVGFVATNRHALSPAVMSVAPLDKHTDIHSGLVFEDSFDVLFIVSDALEAGAAVVYSLNRNEFVPLIRLEKYDNGISSGRCFFVDEYFGGRRFLHVLDRIS
jgi:hypothetical protein